VAALADAALALERLDLEPDHPALHRDAPRSRLRKQSTPGIMVPAFAGTTVRRPYFFAAAARSTKVLPPFIL
jgi:hypothetical protein